MADEEKTCKLIGGAFADVIQLLLFSCAIGTMVFKWHREQPRRQFRVWAWDVSKQGVGAVLQHCINIGVSMILSSHDDECGWYLFNFIVDTVGGVFLGYWLLKQLEKLAVIYNWPSLVESGDYGDPPELMRWIKQAISWGLIIIIFKLIFTLTLAILEVPVNQIVEFYSSPFEGHPKVLLILVMIIAPFFLNIIQFWIFDNILKHPLFAKNGSGNNGRAQLELIIEPVLLETGSLSPHTELV
eukprot:TRINITY_DN3275_c0_g1_i1.p1 TRINITY_DN3275_c0_g1~~TRINITY_DN3275_c0_g1_i1.p1  ORF type:complete len:242 (-),score=31.11 TRINITY_DN3275_c0_g1_i1:169-894(-)